MSNESVGLRPISPADAASVRRWFDNRRAVENLMEQRDSFSLKEADGWARRAAEHTGEDRKFAIVVADRRDPIGFTALYGLFRQTAPELGILIGDRSSVAGVGRAAEALTLQMAFDDFGAHRVYGRIPARNRAAKWVVESLGWRHEATMRGHLLRDGSQPEDCEIWGVLPDEFRAAAADVLG